ncbi:hypothetical protein SLA2020_130280 [Shorea laevis]
MPSSPHGTLRTNSDGWGLPHHACPSPPPITALRPHLIYNPSKQYHRENKGHLFQTPLAKIKATRLFAAHVHEAVIINP